MNRRYAQYLLLLLIAILSCEMKKVETWQRIYVGENIDKAECIAQTTDGSYVVAGSMKDENQYLYGYVLKIDVRGNKINDWLGPKYTDFHAIDMTKDGESIVVGERSDESYIVKLDDNLDKVWEKSYGVIGESIAYSVDQTTDGGYIVAGEIDRLRSDSDYGVAKLDDDGNILWQKEYDSEGDDEAYCVQQTRDGGYIIAGRGAGIVFINYGCVYVVKIDNGGNIEWERKYHDGHTCYAFSIQQTVDGGYIVAGTIGSKWDREPPNNSEVYILKLDENGNKLWDRIYGGDGYDGASCITQTQNGGYIVAGTTRSYGSQGSDVYIIRLDAEGNLLWKKIYGGTGDDKAYFILQTQDGGYIVAGQTESYGADKSDIYVIKMDENGNSTSSPLETASLKEE